MGILRVTAENQARVTAHHARLSLIIEGESFVLGRDALSQSREIRELVAALNATGIKSEHIQVEGVRIANASGLLLKNQKAEFRLSVQATPQELPAALGVIAAHRSAKLHGLDWQFDDFEASIALGASAMQKARRKAEAIAGAAGLAVTGIENASDTWDMPVQTLAFMEPGAGLMSRNRAVSGSLDVGVEYSASQTVTVRLTVDFNIG